MVSGQWSVNGRLFGDLQPRTNDWPTATLNLNVDDLSNDQPSEDLHDHARP